MFWDSSSSLHTIEATPVYISAYKMFQRGPVAPWLYIEMRTELCHTISKAFWASSMVMNRWLPASLASAMDSDTMKVQLAAKHFFVKPNLSLPYWALRMGLILLKNSFSTNFLISEETVILLCPLGSFLASLSLGLLGWSCLAWIEKGAFSFLESCVWWCLGLWVFHWMPA